MTISLRAMKKSIVCNAVIMLLLGLTACKSSFEKVRSSGNPDIIIKTANEYYQKGDYLKAQTLYDLVLNNVKGSANAEQAYFQYAYTHYHQKQFVLGAYYFRNFANTFINSPNREEAAFMSAYCNYKQSPSFRLDQGSTTTAIEDFQLFVNLFPKSERVVECNRLIDELRRKLEEKAFGEGELYYNLKQYQSAVISFDNLLRDYPESPDSERVRYLIAKSNYLLSENSVVDKKEERYASTIERCEDFLMKYEDSKYTKEVKQLKKDAEAKRKALRKGPQT